MTETAYDLFLESKRFDDAHSGFTADCRKYDLFDFQKVITEWALKRGRAAIFADTGLGKTRMQLVWAEEVYRHTGRPVLILAPLAVASQTVREASDIGIGNIQYLRQHDVNMPITVTNYEMMDRFDFAEFGGIVLDESSILKAHDGKTRGEIIMRAQEIPYRLSCTATPSPNDFMELGNQSEYLGIMSRVEMLSMFFIHDGGDTSKWRLKNHGQEKFWEWMSTWSVVVRKPSDLGFSDDGYDLPGLEFHYHFVEAPPSGDDLFGGAAVSLSDQRAAKRTSLDARVAECSRLVNAHPDEPWLIWCHLNDEQDALTGAISDALSVRGSDKAEDKESRMLAFTDGDAERLISKPSICGFGMNWQHCSNMSFVGLDHSFEQFYQAIRRCYRFGQTRKVNVHVYLSEQERPILDNIQRKEAQHHEMSDRMVDHMRDLMRAKITGAVMDKSEYSESTETGENWTMHLGDCVSTVAKMDSDSIHYTVFSPPFASLYTYSNSDRDMGNSSSDKQFYEHFFFLVNELYRVTMPGRLLSFHCMNLPSSKAHDGYIGIRDFRGEMIRMFVNAGWIYHSEVCIWKDPVTAMQRTKALGLLHKQLKKDSAMSRQGIPDYLVTMRKPGENPEPVSHTNESYPVHVWQRVASPIWTDINPSNTLQFRTAKDDKDEKHICPLQLDVIERAIQLWSNPGDLVLSPFAGIGSEGYVAVQMQRRFVGVELKRSYFELAIQNLKDANKTTHDLFSDEA